ncbi:multi-sensor signal transduction histidine kinase [Candidatus Magnetobacterium bavaricum]|uniref:histidine kinase n=1 Tax=Candidatus Magnetobacterium bavaricum TaxID=29290 RepID=A0A0F3GV81_9BACT|nr:multi-sensor signal transduction histidine kinase [Candidatus Magnetobacterium bavaricum]
MRQTIVVVLILGVFYVLGANNYLLFHSFAELFSIVIAFGIFTLAWNSRSFTTNNYLLFLGIAYLFVAFVDTLHALAYKGIGVITGYNENNLPPQLWIIARYMESVSLMIAPVFFRRRLNISAVFIGFVLILTLSLLSVFYWRVFPDCFIEGVGLTRFKVVSEYVICLVLVLALIMLLRNRRELEEYVLRVLALSIVFTICTEISFTFYVHLYGISNVVGHFLKILSFYFIYLALIQTGLKSPYTLLFRDLKKNEEALRISEERYRSLFTKSPAKMLLIDHETDRVVNANPRACSFYGYTLDEMKSIKLSDISVEEPVNAINFAEGRISDLLHRLASGEVRNVRVKSSPIYIDDRLILFMIVSDITQHVQTQLEVKRKQQELQLLNQTLEERVRAEIARRLQGEQMLIQQSKLAAMGEMLSMIAHQWRQPLSSITTIAGDMQVSLVLDEFNKSDFYESLKRINHQAQYLSKTINDFRAFFNPGKKKEDVQLNDLIDKALAIIKNSLDHTSINMEIDCSLATPINTYANEITQVLLNVIRNAQDVIVERKIQLPVIVIKCRDEGGFFVSLDIQDNAGGIPEEIIDKVFDPYFTTKDDSTGTGLGLYMSKMIIEKHCGGELSVKNTGQGACFTIRLPYKIEAGTTCSATKEDVST